MGTGLGSGVMEIVEVRSVVLASADAVLREQLRRSLTRMRWQVRVAAGGAEAMALLEDSLPEAFLMDSWLPDLEAGEFAGQVRQRYPAIDVLRLDGATEEGDSETVLARSPRRNELLHALREAQERQPTDTAAWNAAAQFVPRGLAGSIVGSEERSSTYRHYDDAKTTVSRQATHRTATGRRSTGQGSTSRGSTSYGTASRGMQAATLPDTLLPELIGRSAGMRELARLIRLVAPRSATVLIEGETGTGKDLVAKAIHRLSHRVAKPFVVLNCAAIPEALLEAELFGHTRGAFTGAVQSRTGRIEAAHGGTLFLDEIGEMPPALQAKMLRFLECGELQRVGDNEPVHVDVRVVAATHQPLEKRAAEGTFRLDLYHRLAVFPVEVPPLRERMEDVGLLAEHVLEQMGREEPRKTLSEKATARLQEHTWPGNVRELMHVLERAAILVGDETEIDDEAIRFRRATR